MSKVMPKNKLMTSIEFCEKEGYLNWKTLRIFGIKP